MALCFAPSTIRDYLLGILPEQQAWQVATHLEVCPKCQTHADSLDEGIDPVIRGLRSVVDPSEYLWEPEYRRMVTYAGHLMAGGPVPMRAALPSGLVREELPSSIGVYRIEEVLGFGGMGVVYRAVHTELERPVALKILPPERVDGPQAVARFRQEMRAVGRLRHPHVVAALDAGQADGYYYLAMEYVAGPSFSDLAGIPGGLGVPDACELIRQAAIGLQFVHEQSLIHRDVKPANLMLDASGQVKILDFGLALESSAAADRTELTQAGQTLGTQRYMAPEQRKDSHQVDVRADIFGLGATFCRLLGASWWAGREAGGQSEPGQALAALQAFRPELPGVVWGVVERMLAPAPADRYSSFGELAAALAPFCVGCDLRRVLRNWAAMTGDRASDTHAQVTLETTVSTEAVGAGEPGISGGKPVQWRLSAMGVLVLVVAGLLVGRTFWQSSSPPVLPPDRGTGLRPASARPVAEPRRTCFGTGWLIQQDHAGEPPDVSGQAVAMDGAGNIYLTGSVRFVGDLESQLGPADIFVAKYSPRGEREWWYELGSPEGDDRGAAIGVDEAGLVYVAGQFKGRVDFDPGPGRAERRSAGGTIDAFLLKLTSDGEFVDAWVWGQANPCWDLAVALATDALGRVAVVGHFGGQLLPPGAPDSGEFLLTAAGGQDVFVICWDAAGELQWARSFGGPGWDAVTDLVVDAEGNWYLAGCFSETVVFDPGDRQEAHSRVTALGQDAYVVQLRADGHWGWVQYFGGKGFHQGRGLAVAEDGLYVVGAFQNELRFDSDAGPRFTSRGSHDIVAAKLDRRTGELQWARQAGGPGDDRGRRVAVDARGHVHVVGYFSEQAVFDDGGAARTLVSAGGQDGFIWELSPQGVTCSLSRLGGAEDDAVTAIHATRAGPLVVTGFFQSRGDLVVGERTLRLFAPLERGKDLFLLQRMDFGHGF